MSALIARFGLNEQQIAFVGAYVRGGSVHAAAVEAGYIGGQAGWYQIRLPHVLAAVHAETQRSLLADAPVSLSVLRKIRDDDAAPARVRADISLQLMKMAGHVVPTHKADAPGKQLSEMTQAELLDYIEKNQVEIDRAVGELADKAKDVSAQVSAQDLDEAEPKSLGFLD